MDSAGFNAEIHIASVLKASSLEKLLAEHRSMAREIKTLDSDMQQLVYENYNKVSACLPRRFMVKGTFMSAAR